jgi:hypothetical protein
MIDYLNIENSESFNQEIEKQSELKYKPVKTFLDQIFTKMDESGKLSEYFSLIS